MTRDIERFWDWLWNENSENGEDNSTANLIGSPYLEAENSDIEGSESDNQCDSSEGGASSENPDPDEKDKKEGKATKKLTNSAGKQVERKLVKNQDELLEEAERAAGGSLDDYENYKPDWYESPDGNRRIEWNTEGHSTTNEGPHVTVRDFNGKRHSVTEKIFIEGQEKYK